ncbi:hypothetical protein BP6252_07627 [Coleophoma cylindrospora]|uniref:Uncharacterized protein n=1 Tax=Coleophoma cylindrospora TaxID=1849047 RepID=A0A3D8RB24_9HELO|nr:hypothetical protein BP6252_07627 [Coleophoma cylindrospora]
MQYTRFTQLMLLLAFFSSFGSAAILGRRGGAGEYGGEPGHGYGYGDSPNPGYGNLPPGGEYSGSDGSDSSGSCPVPTSTHTVLKTIHETIKVKTTKTAYTTVKNTEKVHVTVTRTETNHSQATTTITAAASTITDFIDVTTTITEPPETETVTVTDEVPCISY